jgi:NitT/TauT family transport system substrate-binding protein
MKSGKTAALIVALLSAAAGGCSSTPSSKSLAIFGNLETIEIAPVLVAADRLNQPALVVNDGGIPNLVGDWSRADPGAGLADIGAHAETQLLRYSVKRPDLRIILTVAEGHYRIVARRSAGIAELQDLAGKRVATIKPTSSGYFLSRMLDRAGLSYDDIVMIPIGELTDVPDMMADGAVDAVAIWEPQSENVRQILGADYVEFSGRGTYRELFNLNTTTATLTSPTKRQQVVQFVRSVILAARAIEADPAEARHLVARAGGFDEAEVEAAWQHHSFPANLPEDLLETLVEEEKWLAEMEGRAPRSRDVLNELIDYSIYAEAIQGI